MKFPLYRWLRESATMRRCAFIACFVHSATISVWSRGGWWRESATMRRCAFIACFVHSATISVWSRGGWWTAATF